MECFTVYADEIEGRVDPPFYRPLFIRFDKRIRSIKYEVKEVKDFSKVICGPFGSSIKVKDYRDSGVPLVRISNVDKNQYLSKENTIFITEKLAQKLKSYTVKKGDLIISQRGTIGLIVKISDFFDGGVISANFIAIKNLKGISPDYLKIFLSSQYGQIQLVRKTSGQVQTKITTDDIKSLIIPIPHLEIQNHIVQIMDKAYEIKKQKETEAQQLLNSIDDYVLSELGITHPPDEKKTCYSIYYSDIEGRIDPSPYHPKRINAIKVIKSSEYKKCQLKNFVKFKREIITSNNQDVPYIGLENIESNTGLFIPSKEIKESFGSAFQFNNGDILFPKLRPYLNKVHLAEFDGVCSTEFHVLESKSCNNIYLSNFLRSKIVVNQTSYLMTGNTLPRLQTIDVENLLIPVPSNETQNKIAGEIKARMQKAEQLRKEAKEVLEEAKERVERIILGEEEI